MTRDELFRELLGRGLSPYAVYIDGVRDDGWLTDCWYLLERPDGFEVGYQERNQFSSVGTYADEATACAAVFDRIASSMHWPARPSRRGEPIGWNAAMREDAQLNSDGDIELRVPDGGVNPITVDDLVRRDVLRHVRLVEDEEQR